MRAYVVVFPGSNCDRDVVHSLATRLKTPVLTLWYEENHLPSDADLVVLPGGFSYGDTCAVEPWQPQHRSYKESKIMQKTVD